MKVVENAVNAPNTNRKWHLALLVVIIATIGLFAPPLLSVWLFGAKQPLTILSGTEFVSIVTLVVSCYFGANVWQRHVETKNLTAAQQMEEATATPVDDESDDFSKEA